jgi:hypothetical protein
LFFSLLFVFARDRPAAVATEAIELELTTAQLVADRIFCVFFRLFGVNFCVASVSLLRSTLFLVEKARSVKNI